MPLITIITPNKNHLAGLRLSSESLEKQTFRDWEHLIIDSASTDGSVEYARDRPQTRILSEPDNCVEIALNKGLRLATGKYVTFLLCYDALMDPDWLKTAVEYLEQNPNYSMVTACSGTTRSQITYNFDTYPTGHKFTYFFFMAGFTSLNDTAFVTSTNVLRSCFPKMETNNRGRDILFQNWINFLESGYVVQIFPYAVVTNGAHEDSRYDAEMINGDYLKKMHDFLDEKRRVRRLLLAGKYRITFLTSQNEKYPHNFSRLRFTLVVMYYKCVLFVIKKILRRETTLVSRNNI